MPRDVHVPDRFSASFTKDELQTLETILTKYGRYADRQGDRDTVSIISNIRSRVNGHLSNLNNPSNQMMRNLNRSSHTRSLSINSAVEADALADALTWANDGGLNAGIVIQKIPNR